jgi:hypothetical protein
MAYSNTNKDKVQIEWKKKLKNTGVTVILLIIVISAWTNIIQQMVILHEAESRNKKAEEKISKLMEENQKYEKQVEYATTSAYKQRQVREDLGLGNNGEVWLAADLGTAGTTVEEETAIDGEKPMIVQWWNLFTK